MGGTLGSDDGYEAGAFMAQPQSDTDPWPQPGSDPWQWAITFASSPSDGGTTSDSNVYGTQSWGQGHVHNNYLAYNAVSPAATRARPWETSATTIKAYRASPP